MTGYTRQSSADILPGEDIIAEPLNREFNQLQAAFNGSTGHNHSGGTGQGPKISLTTSVSGTLPIANGGTGATDVTGVKTALNLGSISEQDKNAVDITGGTIVGITDLAIADGGTGASDASTAFNNLKQVATDTTTGVVEIATVSEFRGDTAGALSLTPEKVWDSAEEVTLTDAATISVDMNTFINAVVTLNGNRTLGNPSNAKVGQSGVIRIINTGSRTLAFGSNWLFAGGVDPTLPSGSNENYLFYHVIASNKVFGVLAKDVS